MNDAAGPPDLRAHLFAAQDWYVGLAAAVPEDQRRNPTPCESYDVRTLMAHVGAVFDKIVGLARDKVDPYAGSHGRVDLELERLAAQDDARTPDERGETLRRRADLAREVWTEEVLDAEVSSGWGPVAPGRVVAAVYLMEVLTHGWDLATATGQSAEAPEPTARAGLAAATTGLPESPRGAEVGVPFGPVVEPAPDAGITERLANWTGRITRPDRSM